jgi:hypothetical protein
MSRDQDEPEVIPQGQMKLTWYSEGDEVSHVFPSVNEVCDRCEGYGTHLTPSIGNHAYTSDDEEMHDPEFLEEYTKRGGIYDVQCEVCHGNKVVPVVDEDKLNEEQKKLFTEYEEYMEEKAADDAADRRTRYMESGGALSY